MTGSAARRALALLIAVVVSWQAASIPLARWTLSAFFGGTDAYSQWTSYSSAAAPRVLFVGDSRVRSHVDTEALAAALSSSAGVPVTVGKIGVSGATPAYLDALVYRIAHRDSRPRLLVVSLSEYQFNASLAADLTSDYWQISEPPDPGYVVRALGDSTDPGRLLAGWTVPALANNRAVAYGIRCAYRTRTAPDACKDEEQMPDLVMTPESRAALDELYRTLHLADYRYSERDDDATRRLVAEARAAGIAVVLLVPPMLDFEDVAPSAYATFTARVRRIAAEIGSPLLDLHTEMRDRLELWRDPSHLNRTGARAFAPVLARAIQ